MLIAERYRLQREVGRGGMGAVWLAEDTVLGRPVALKRVGLLPGSDGADLDRVAREARVSAMLNHEHVVAVYDLVTEGADHWLVMEYLASDNLSTFIKERGPLSADETAGLMVQAAGALAAAHQAGIVHRDVKPSNMLVTPDGLLKLGDFGIARAGDDPSLTRTGMVTGSPGYLSPEVAAGHGATEASDMWSFGATIFHAVTGQPPYDTSENLMGALYRIVHEEPVRTNRADWLDPLLRATMHTDPAGRWTARQVITFLRSGPHAALPAPLPVAADSDAITSRAGTPTADATSTNHLPAVGAVARPETAPDSSGPGHAAPRRKRSFTPLWVLLAVALVVGLTVGAWLLGSRDEDTPPSAGGSNSATPSDTASSPTEPASPTAEEMIGFAEDYVSAAASDPEAGFRRLTPAYQKESDGLEGYSGFWGNVRDPQVSNLAADPDALTVSYDFNYVLEGQGRKSERITLDLDYDDGVYLIRSAGATDLG